MSSTFKTWTLLAQFQISVPSQSGKNIGQVSFRTFQKRKKGIDKRNKNVVAGHSS